MYALSIHQVCQNICQPLKWLEDPILAISDVSVQKKRVEEEPSVIFREVNAPVTEGRALYDFL